MRAINSITLVPVKQELKVHKSCEIGSYSALRLQGPPLDQDSCHRERGTTGPYMLQTQIAPVRDVSWDIIIPGKRAFING